MPLQAGDDVFYVPDAIHMHDLAKNDTGQRMEPVWHWEIDHPSRRDHGQLASLDLLCQHFPRKGSKDDKHRVLGETGIKVKDMGPRNYWPAKIVAVNPDGTATISFDHPNGTAVHEYPKVKHDPGKALHTFHIAGE
jgi:hypothetical protein